VFSFEELYESRSRDLGLVADVNKAFRTTLDEHGVDRKVTFPAIEAGMKAFATRRYEEPGAETLLPDISPPNPGADITSLENCPLFSLWADIQAGRAGDESLKEDPAVNGSTKPSTVPNKAPGSGTTKPKVTGSNPVGRIHRWGGFRSTARSSPA
jgi:hypothetical protein